MLKSISARRFYIIHYDNEDVGMDIRGFPEKDRSIDLKTGIEIAPNLKIRFASKEDADLLAPFNPPKDSIVHCTLNQYVLECTIEVEDSSETSAKTQHHITRTIDSAVQALRLFKAGYIDANTILWANERNADKQTSLSAKTHSSDSMREYCLATREITEFRELVARTLEIDLEKRKSLHIALDRFNRARPMR